MTSHKKILELTIDRIALGGEALASYQGKKIFIPWGVPGDRVKAELIEEKKDFARAKIVEILEKSAHRTNPPCPYFFRCGGCQWQHLKYESQVHFKTEILKEALERIAKIRNPHVKEGVSAESPLHYRNRIRLQISRQGVVGFFKTHSKEVVPIDRCLIAEERLNEKIPEAKALAQKLLDKDRAKLHEIEIRFTSLSPSPSTGEGEKIVLEADPSEEIPFTQVNSAQNERLIALVTNSLELHGSENILELFAGDGNFSFPISKHAQFVTAVETNEASVLEAEKRIEREHRKNIQFVQSTAYRFLENISGRGGSRTDPTNFDRVLLDPPRKGALECLEGIAKLKIPLVTYVSCDPATLARDVKILAQLGYRHDFSQVIDMFPQTYHVESVTVLTRGS
jgi:23S rRNA (uracil1939-C5)-methyltransferase